MEVLETVNVDDRPPISNATGDVENQNVHDGENEGKVSHHVSKELEPEGGCDQDSEVEVLDAEKEDEDRICSACDLKFYSIQEEV